MGVCLLLDFYFANQQNAHAKPQSDPSSLGGRQFEQTHNIVIYSFLFEIFTDSLDTVTKTMPGLGDASLIMILLAY